MTDPRDSNPLPPQSPSDEPTAKPQVAAHAVASAPAATVSGAATGPPPVSPRRLAWRRLRKNRTAMLGGLILLFLYSLSLFGSFISTSDPTQRNYNYLSHPPTLPRFVDETGKFHFRPFVYGMYMADPIEHRWDYDLTKKYPLKFFVRGYEYKLWWLFKTDIHLVGVDAPGLLAFFGTDGAGKDVFSRVIEGGKVSLSIGIVGITISLIVGMLMGAVAGYFGGLTDSVIMRLVEFLLSIPSLYLIIALRAFFQSNEVLGIGGPTMSSSQMYLIIIILLSMIGWAAQARVIRGMVLSLKEQDFVSAERALGASTFRILTLHILPNTFSYVIISASIAVPGYILGEIALSFLGVGIQEPQVSWGLMLDAAKDISIVKEFPWLLFPPAIFIFLTVMAFNFLGDGLRDALDPRHTK